MKSRVFAVVGICLTLAVAAAVAHAATGDTLGVSTLIQRIVPTGGGDFKTLTTAPGEPYVIRDGSEVGAALGEAKPGREGRRKSLAYFGQLTDFQLADEESPARVEFLDPQGGPFTSAWRPAEALNLVEENEIIKQMNAFSKRPPNRSGIGRPRAGMDFVVNTGDIADSQQYNEVLWNRQLVEGGLINPNSGVDPAPYVGTNPLCPADLTIQDAEDPSLYTGVQDRNDWPGGQEGYFYEPDAPGHYPASPGAVRPYANAPSYPGLMDRAQNRFRATGLDVPSYMAFGNHDTLVQGNAWATATFNKLATGCLKPVNDAQENSGLPNTPLFGLVVNPSLTENQVLDLYESNPEYFIGVPPDPKRRLVSKKTYKNIFKAGNDPSGHGFGFVDRAEEKASNGAAGYYSFSPRRGVRFITLDTNSEGGKVLVSSEGNLDNPQFEWFEKELKKATARNELVIVFSHHAVTSLGANIPDENALACGTAAAAGAPGCDADPRASTPIRLEDDLMALMHEYPNAIAWVAGHSHDNRVIPYPDPEGNGGFWSIRTAAIADWPKQNRLIELFDNRDGNLSIFGTVIDHAAPVPAPAPSTSAAGMNVTELASLARTIGYNDTQSGGEQCSPNRCGEGEAADRNVELLIRDPRRKEPDLTSFTLTPKRRAIRAGDQTVLTVRVRNTGTAPAPPVKVRMSSSNPRVRIQKIVRVGRIGRDQTVSVRVRVRTYGRSGVRARIAAVLGSFQTGKLMLRQSTLLLRPRGGRR
jgi:metallophosphoesterase (TIGR03767 family)